jgi:hypothetical protein
MKTIRLAQGISRACTIAILTAVLGGCSLPHRVKLTAADIPYSKQVQMKKGESYEFQLPDGKMVAVWCERPKAGTTPGEQTTGSGLKTAWGEHPFKQPEPMMQKAGSNSWVMAGWKTYIVPGAVTAGGEGKSEYELFVDDLRFRVAEDLGATNGLPVTFKIGRK